MGAICGRVQHRARVGKVFFTVEANGCGTQFFWMPENSGNSKPTLGGSWLDGVTGVERATRPSGGQLARLPPANWFSLNHDPHRPPLIFPLLSIQPIEANFRIDENH